MPGFDAAGGALTAGFAAAAGGALVAGLTAGLAADSFFAALLTVLAFASSAFFVDCLSVVLSFAILEIAFSASIHNIQYNLLNTFRFFFQLDR